MSLSPQHTLSHGLLTLQLSTRRLLPKHRQSSGPSLQLPQRTSKRLHEKPLGRESTQRLSFPPIANTERPKPNSNAQSWQWTLDPQFRVSTRFNELAASPKAQKSLKKVLSSSRLDKPKRKQLFCTQTSQTDFPLDEYDSWAAEDLYCFPYR